MLHMSNRKTSSYKRLFCSLLLHHRACVCLRVIGTLTACLRYNSCLMCITLCHGSFSRLISTFRVSFVFLILFLIRKKSPTVKIFIYYNQNSYNRQAPQSLISIPTCPLKINIELKMEDDDKTNVLKVK